MAKLEDWDVLLGLFPTGWRELGRSTGAVRRLRGFASVEAVLRMILLHVGCGLSLRETAVEASLGGLAEVSDVTVMNRLRDAEPWLLELCRLLWKENGVDLENGVLGRPARLLDATIVREPGQSGSQWRLHYSLRLPKLACDHFELTPTRGQGVAERFGRFKFKAGELVLGDAGYCHAAGIAAIAGQKADVCVRLNPNGISLRDANGEPFPLLQHLAGLRKAGALGDWPVRIVHEGSVIEGRVCAIRKTRLAIKQAQRRLDRKRNKGQTVVADTRKYAAYVMVFTSLTAEAATAAQVLEAYRLRWQIELAFKRLKSTINFGHVPKHDPQSSRAWLYAKLLIALLSEKLSRLGRSFSPWGYFLAGENAQHMA